MAIQILSTQITLDLYDDKTQAKIKTIQLDDQLYLMGNCGACTSPFKGNMGETNSDLARISGTPTEDCFNIYSFDLANRLVKVARIGANVNDRMTERKMAVYSI